MSWTQTCFGLGYMLGPGVGAWFYEMGGFMLPFLVVGSLSTLLSLLLIVTIPNVAGGGDSNTVVEIEGFPDERTSLVRNNSTADSEDSGASCSYDGIGKAAASLDDGARSEHPVEGRKRFPLKKSQNLKSNHATSCTFHCAM